MVSHYYRHHNGKGGHFNDAFLRLLETKGTADVSSAVDLSDVVIDNTGWRHNSVKFPCMSSEESWV